jgi:hypothetical protein
LKEGAELPFTVIGDLGDAVTGRNGGAGTFLDKYFPIRPAYRLYRTADMLRSQGCDRLADQYDAAADQLTAQVLLVGLGGLTGWEKDAVDAPVTQPRRFGPGAAHRDDPSVSGGGFLKKLFGPKKSAAELADEAMRARRVPVPLGELKNIGLPDYGDKYKVSSVEGMDDDRLLKAINDPDELGSVIVISNGEVVQGNHRIAEALKRMGKPYHPKIKPDTMILVIR